VTVFVVIIVCNTTIWYVDCDWLCCGSNTGRWVITREKKSEQLCVTPWEKYCSLNNQGMTHISAFSLCYLSTCIIHTYFAPLKFEHQKNSDW